MLTMFLTLFFSLVASAVACMPTNPGGGITPPSQCCPIGIFDEGSSGMAVFDPALRECPATAQLICSVAVVGNKDPTTIVINGDMEVTREADGHNTKAILTCRKEDKTWRININGNDIPLTTIACNNKP